MRIFGIVRLVLLAFVLIINGQLILTDNVTNVAQINNTIQIGQRSLLFNATKLPTTTTSTTLPTTTTTIKEIISVDKFELTEIVYVNETIQIDYLIKSSRPDSNAKIPVNVSIDCRSVDYAQAWSLNVPTYLDVSEKLRMLPLNQSAAPGSLINCKADIISVSGLVVLKNLKRASIQLLTSKYFLNFKFS